MITLKIYTKRDYNYASTNHYIDTKIQLSIQFVKFIFRFIYLILYYITRYNIYHIFLPISNAQLCNRLISLNARQSTTTQTINYAQNYFPNSRPYIEWWYMMTRKKTVATQNDCCYNQKSTFLVNIIHAVVHPKVTHYLYYSIKSD